MLETTQFYVKVTLDFELVMQISSAQAWLLFILAMQQGHKSEVIDK